MQYDTVDIMNGNSLKLQDVIRGLPLVEGKNPTGIPFVTAWRFTQETIQMPQAIVLIFILCSMGSSDCIHLLG